MDDYIKRENAIAAVEFDITYATAININTGVQREIFGRENAALERAVVRLRNVPAADVRPVVRARWIESKDTWEDDWGSVTESKCVCSACGYTQKKTNICAGSGYIRKSKQCPECGAMMDGEAADDSSDA